MNLRKSNKLLALLTAAAILFSYHIFLSGYFPNIHGRMGHDYALTLNGLLDGYIWYRQNGLLSPPWFSPSFCAGQAFFADPQSIFYSTPQFIAFFTSPVDAAYISAIIFAAIGLIGMYLLCKKLQLQTQTSLVASTLFLFNGFYSSRMIVGHYGYQPFMLIPLMALLSIPLLNENLKKNSWRTDIPSGIALGVCAAYCFHAGMTTLLVALSLSLLIVAFIAKIRSDLTYPQYIKHYFFRSSTAFVVAVGLCASKLSANISLMSHFSRDYYPLPGVSETPALIKYIYTALFFSSQSAYEAITPHWRNIAIPALPHELGYGLTPLAVIPLVVGTGYFLIKLSREKSTELSEYKSTLFSMVMITLIASIPTLLLYYSPEWNSFLKSLPLVGSTTSPYRWLLIYIAPTCIACAILLEQISSKIRAAICYLMIAGIPILNAMENRDFYTNQFFDPAPVQNFYADIKTGKKIPAINRVSDPRLPDGTPTAFNDSFTNNETAIRCYNPIYGYGLEKLPESNLRSGPTTLQITKNGLNLRNPACQVFPDENKCRPGDVFKTSQTNDLLAFTHYKPYKFEKSTRQQICDFITKTFILLTMLAGILMSSIWIKNKYQSLTHQKQPNASQP